MEFDVATPAPTVGAPQPAAEVPQTGTLINLAPFTPTVFPAPLLVTGKATDLAQPGKLSLDDDLFISWAVTSRLPNDLQASFFVDVYFDDIFVNRWNVPGLDGNSFVFVEDFPAKDILGNLLLGLHEVRLVVDPTNQVRESIETDNETFVRIIWEQGLAPNPSPPVGPLLDLQPASPPGWSAPVIASVYNGDREQSQLSDTVETFVSYAWENAGLNSTNRRVTSHLYLDDRLVQSRAVDGILSEGTVAAQDVELSQVFGRLAPGPHTLRVVLDPHDLILETNEANNVATLAVDVGTGSVPASPPQVAPLPVRVPTPLDLPNLAPHWEIGTDGPIVVAHTDRPELDEPLTIQRATQVRIRVSNKSGLPAGRFDTELFLDDERIERFQNTAGLAGGLFLSFETTILAGSLAPGEHTLRIVIDPAGQVAEADEADNVYERTLIWAEGEPDTPEPIAYSESDLRGMLAGLDELLDDRGSALDSSRDLTRRVLAVADASYYVMTGRALADERADIFLLRHDDYQAWIDELFAERFAASLLSEYQQLAEEREQLKRIKGFTTRRLGRVAVVVDAEQPVADVLNTLAHEIGHMRQGLIAPAQSSARGAAPEEELRIKALHEAEAQQFERAFWLQIEDFLGVTILAYPAYEVLSTRLDETVATWIETRLDDEHDMGYLVQWLAVLDDPELAHLASPAAGASGLNAAQALELYDYFLAIPGEEAAAYVNERLAALQEHADDITSAAASRLGEGLGPEAEGPPDLRVPALLMP